MRSARSALRAAIADEPAWPACYLCEFVDEQYGVLPYDVLQARTDEGLPCHLELFTVSASSIRVQVSAVPATGPDFPRALHGTMAPSPCSVLARAAPSATCGTAPPALRTVRRLARSFHVRSLFVYS